MAVDMNKQALRQLLFLDAAPKLLIELYRNRGNKSYVSRAARNIHINSPHIFNILPVLEKHNLVLTQKNGRMRYITLTKSGEELAESLHKFERKWLI